MTAHAAAVPHNRPVPPAAFALLTAASVFWFAGLALNLVAAGLLALPVYAAGVALLWPSLRTGAVGRLARVCLLVTPAFVALPGSEPLLLNYYGSAWFIGVMAAIAWTVITVFLALRWPERFSVIRVSTLRLALAVIALLLLAALAVTMAFRPSGQNIAAVAWNLGVVPLALWAALASAHRPDAVIRHARRWLMVGGAALTMAGVALSLASVRSFPNFMNTDEPWTISFADTTGRTGEVWATMFPTGEVPLRSAPRIYLAVSAWMNLWGGDLFAARTFSLAAGLLLLPVLYAAARALFDRATAWVSVLLMATSIFWMAVSHIARPEIALTLGVWSSIALLAWAQKRDRPLLALVGGLLLGLSADVHLFGAFYCVIVGLWRLASIRSLRAEKWQLAAFVVGGLAGAVVFALYHVLPDPASITRSVAMNEASPVGGGLYSLLAIVTRSADRYRAWLEANPIEFALLIVGSTTAIFALRDRSRLWIIIAASLLLYAVVITDTNMYYPMVWMPALVLLTAHTLTRVAWPWRVMAAVLLCAMLLVTAFRVGAHVQSRWNERAVAALQQVAARLPADADLVVGQPLVYLALRDPRFLSAGFVTWRSGGSFLDALLAARPDYVITSYQDWIFDDRPNTLGYGQVISLPIPFGEVERFFDPVYNIQTDLGVLQILRPSENPLRETDR